MDVRPIRTAEDHRAAVAEIEALWNAEPGSPEDDRLDVLATLVSAYEDEHFKIEAADPVEVVKEVMETRGYTQKDLAAVLGSSSRASEILRGRRDFSIQHIRALTSQWHIPAGVLIGVPAAVEQDNGAEAEAKQRA